MATGIMLGGALAAWRLSAAAIPWVLDALFEDVDTGVAAVVYALMWLISKYASSYRAPGPTTLSA